MFKKALFSVSVLLGVFSVLFLIIQVLSINSALTILGDKSDLKTQTKLIKKFHLDQPNYKRYLIEIDQLSPISIYSSDSHSHIYYQSYYGGVKIISIQNHSLYLKYPYLGQSFQSSELVSHLLWKRFQVTIILTFTSILFASIFGIIFGILSAKFNNTWIDQSIMVFTSLGVSAPSFFIAILLAISFGYYWSEWTGLSFKGNLYEYDDLGNRYLCIKNLILPTIALGWRPIAIICQLTRNSILTILKEDFIRTARAKGLSEHQIFFKHALRNALNPVITSISGWLGSLLAGAYFIEIIFDIKGLGSLTVNAMMKFDIPVVMGASLYIAMIFVLISLFVDYLYRWIDPRILN